MTTDRLSKFAVGQAVRVTSLREGWVKDAHVIKVEEQTLIVKLDHDNMNVFRVNAGFVSAKETT